MAVAAQAISRAGESCPGLASAIRLGDGSIEATCTNGERYRIATVNGVELSLQCSRARANGNPALIARRSSLQSSMKVGLSPKTRWRLPAEAVAEDFQAELERILGGDALGALPRSLVQDGKAKSRRAIRLRDGATSVGRPST